MRIISFEFEGEKSYGIETQDMKTIWLLENMIKEVKGEAPANTLELIEQYSVDEITEIFTKTITISNDPSQFQLPAGKVDLLAPIIPRNNVIGFGKNYSDHIAEVNSVEEIYIFTKATSSIVGYAAEVPNHQDVTDQLDYEVELGVVIGKEAYKVKAEDAYDYIFGYTVVNDITDRKAQDELPQSFISKSLAGTCPMGPAIVTTDEIKDPHNLRLQTKVNDEVKQDSNTSQMITKVPEIIEFLSNYIVLQPGDVIATGTPSGTAVGMDEPTWLQPGDLVEASVEKIGTLTNRIAE